MRVPFRPNAIPSFFGFSTSRIAFAGDFVIAARRFCSVASMEYSTWSHEDLVKRVAKLESELRAQNEKDISPRHPIKPVLTGT